MRPKELDRVRVRETWLERAVGRLFPQTMARRMRSRLELEYLRTQRYDGGRRDRGVDDWTVRQTSADYEISVDGPTLRSRMRDLERNSSLVANAIQVLVNAAVGEGLKPRPRSTNKSLNQRVSAAWERWAEDVDTRGQDNFGGLTALAVRGMITGGETFGRMRTTVDVMPDENALRIELIEPERVFLTQYHTGQRGRRRIRSGIEYDDMDRPVAYHFQDIDEELSSSLSPDIGGHLGTVRVPADQVVHLFEKQRVQSRGVPWGAPSMREFRQLDDYVESELMRKKLESCVVGVVLRDDGARPALSSDGGDVVKDSSGNTMEWMEPGMLVYAHGAKDVRFNQPTASTGQAEWMRTHQHIAAAGFRVPYALLTGDLSQANFASSRVAINDFRRTIRLLQSHVIVPRWCRPIWQWWIMHASLTGEFDYEELRTLPVRWIPPRFESVDPMKDVQADVVEVRSGFSTLSEQIARRGHDPDEQLEEIQRTNEALDEKEILLDIDPRTMTRAGAAQSAGDASGEQEAGPDDGGEDGPPTDDDDDDGGNADADADDDDEDDDADADD